MNTRPLRVLVVDDENLAREELCFLLDQLGGCEVVGEAADGVAALRMTGELRPDLLFLDVQMPGLTGLDLSSAATDLGVEVILATAHSEHAVTAFAHGVADYVLKPVEEARLALAIDRARARLAPKNAATPSRTARLAISVKGELRLVAPADLAYAMLESELVKLRIGDEVIWSELTLQELESRLPSDDFVRVHRRALLNLAHVDRLRPLPSGGYVAITRSGDEVPVSRQEARRLRQRLGI